MNSEKNDNRDRISRQIEQLAINLLDKNTYFSPRTLLVLSRLYRNLNDGLTGRDIETLIKSHHSSATQLATRLTSIELESGVSIHLCTYNNEEGMGRYKVLRFTTSGLRWYEENILAVFET